MEKKSYAELLKDPRWQKKRLEIMQRDNFTCQHCLATEKSLQVHHLVYEKGKKPWEYENDELITLCERCHQNEECENSDSYVLFKELKEAFQHEGYSIELLNSILTRLSESVIFGKNNEDVNDDFSVNLIRDSIYGTQNYSDVISAKKHGLDMYDFVLNVYPKKIDHYNSVE